MRSAKKNLLRGGTKILLVGEACFDGDPNDIRTSGISRIVWIPMISGIPLVSGKQRLSGLITQTKK